LQANDDACLEHPSNRRNPFNGLHVTKMSSCPLNHIEQYRKLSEAEHDGMMDLPCGCELVPLRKLSGGYSFNECD